MKKYHLLAVAVFFIVVLFASCASKPPEAPPPAPPPVAQPQAPSQAKVNELGAAMKNLENARQRAFDFKSPSYFPSEWEEAEKLYTQAVNLDYVQILGEWERSKSGQPPQGTDSDIQKAIDAYNAAANSYDAVFALALPLYAQAAEDEIMAVRGELMNAGLRDSFPEYFIPADETAVQALNHYEAKDYYPAKDTAEHAYGMYDFMKQAYDVWLIRQDIVEAGLEKYSPDDFDSADGYFAKAMDAYLAKEDMEALLNANEAAQRYNLVLEAGRLPYAEHQYALAATERQAALDVRADVAVKDTFAGADSVFKGAAGLMESKNYEEAVKESINARDLFIESRLAALDKRRIAAEAIQEAEEVIDEVIQNARQAELNTRGGTR